MGGYNPQSLPRGEARMRELDKLAKTFKKDAAELARTIKAFKALLRDLKKAKS